MIPSMSHATEPPSDDRLLRRDIRASMTIAALAVLLSGGLLYLWALWRVWRTARDAPIDADPERALLVFGKRLAADGNPDAEFIQRLSRAHHVLVAASGHQRELVLLGAGEAPAGARVLRQMGMPQSIRLHLEDRSLHTLDNLRNARDLLGPRRRVILLSSRSHLARCSALARQLGLDFTVCAAEDRLTSDRPMWRVLQGEAVMLCWLQAGTGWARLIRHQRMLARVT